MKKYWTSLEQRDGSFTAPDADPHRSGPASMSRRGFLEAAGFTISAAAVSGCGRPDKARSLPFAIHPEGMIPGRMKHYASTCAGCSAGCGLLVGTRDGRPLKMEGLSARDGLQAHPLSQGGLCAIGQALPLGLYDSRRLAQPEKGGEQASWDEVDKAINKDLKQIKGGQRAVRVVTGTITSPTLKATIDAFLADFDDGWHVTLDNISSSAILDAHAKTHRARVLPHYKFDQAQVIASFGADFLGTWISPVEFTAGWRQNRVPTEQHREMSHHVQFEGRMSLTGTNADKRHRLAPHEYGAALSQLALKLAKGAGQTPPSGSAGESPNRLVDEALQDLADRLLAAPGESLVISDSQDVAVQLLVNWINQQLGNYGKTLDVDRPSRQKQGRDGDVLKLAEELNSGRVAALIVAGTDLAHNLPDWESLKEALDKVPLVISLAEREDELSEKAHFLCPDHHPLEGWMDYEPVDGLISLSQPTIQPLGETRSVLESFARWSGKQGTAYELLRASWRTTIASRALLPVKPQEFNAFWDGAVHDGFITAKDNPTPVGEFRGDDVKLLRNGSAAEGYTLSLYTKVGMTDARHAHNAWLQELPDPVTKATWDNYVCISEEAHLDLSIETGDVVEIDLGEGQPSLKLPALVQPGQHPRVIAIALNYGVQGTDRFYEEAGFPEWLEGQRTVEEGGTVGKNAAPLIDARDDALHYDRDGIRLTKTGDRHDVARTQLYHSMEVPEDVAPRGAEEREPIQEISLAEYVANPEAGKVEHLHAGGSHGEHGDEHAGQEHEKKHDAADEEHAEEQPKPPTPLHDRPTQLWAEDHPKTGHWWGMAIDLNACTGCSACLIACQSENNVPVVGKDEVRRQREMHWIRIDRYYSGKGADVEVAHQPMMCQHCDNAPCETVCPVLATIHGEEGLNEQAYNRCVGTRYCANNCPYKVRRFNWFEYAHDDELQNLALNPDVTVRSQGVMEKCSMCVQRIEEAKIDSKRRGEPLTDGDIQTACQQSCPAQAITFGDMNPANDALQSDVEESRIQAALNDPRRYEVLEELNFRSSVSYLRKVRNHDAKQTEDD